jgi:hypothetical protein
LEIAAGSVIGKDHLRSRRPNQDAHFILRRPDLIVAVVCDGCGSSPYSEVGARLAVRWVANAIAASQDEGRLCLETARGRVLETMARLAETLAGRPPARASDEARTPSFGVATPDIVEIVRDYLLFTVVGAAITPEEARFFSLGDGALIVNEAPIALGPFPDNAPPYLAYSLLDSSLLTLDPALLQFQVHRRLPTAELDSFLIGSDGALEIEERADELLPNRSRAVGPLSQFWQEDATFTNPQAVSRKLALMGTDSQSVDWDARRIEKRPGLLHDDTTLIVGRRSPGARRQTPVDHRPPTTDHRPTCQEPGAGSQEPTKP